MAKRVAIVGAGISGLLACKYVVSIGLNPIVFEADDEAGGLWNHTIESTRLQVGRHAYQFSDFPWPPSVQDMFPRSSQVVEYFNSYAHHFKLFPYIKFNSKVMKIDYVGESEEEMQSWELWGGAGRAFGSKGKWILQVFHAKEDAMKEYEAEFVVVCIGRFSGYPNIPESSSGIFSGKVLHSSEYSAMENASAREVIRGKRVVIVGSSKSAMDIAYECANVNGNEKGCTMIQRTVHWALPDPYPLGINFLFLFYIRFPELTIHKPGEGILAALLATLLTPLGWLMFKLIEMYIRWKLPLKKYDMIPKESLLRDAASCRILFLPHPNFYDKVEDGSIVIKKSQHFSFCEEGLMIDGESDLLKADVVILATGFKGDEKLKNIFASPTFQNYIAGSSPTSIIPLYRQMIHPRIPQLAVIGYSESFSNIYTSEIRCKWLARLLDQGFELPGMKEMKKEVETWEKFMKGYSSKGECRRACIGLVQIWYNDQLCKDIGINPRRKKGVLSELFQPYFAMDYKD